MISAALFQSVDESNALIKELIKTQDALIFCINRIQNVAECAIERCAALEEIKRICMLAKARAEGDAK